MFTVNDFQDLIQIIESRPEWRHRLKKALFPETDLEIALRELVESGKQLEAIVAKLSIGQEKLKQDVSVLKQDVSVLKQDVSVLKQDVSVLKQDVSVLKQDVSELKQDMRYDKTDLSKLKGRSQEEFYRQRADAVFGLYLRKGANATSWIADLLYDKAVDGVVSQDEVKQVLAADILWSGETRASKQSVVVVMEASWLAEESDVTRAVQRARILQRVGVKAIPVVGGDAWSDSARHMALELLVVTTENGRLDEDSWLRVLENMN